MSSFRRITSLLLTLALLLSLAACGGTAAESSSSETEELPSSYETGTPVESEPESGVEALPADERFSKLQSVQDTVSLNFHLGVVTPDVTAEPSETPEENPVRALTEAWASSMPNTVDVTFTQLSANDNFWDWTITACSAGIGPDLVYIWGDQRVADAGWFFDLTQAAATPNYYETGEPVWQDMLAPYLLEPNFDGLRSSDGRLIAFPMLVSPGAITAIAYNADLLDSMKWHTTKNWDEFMDICEDIRDVENHTGLAPSLYNLTPGFSSWEGQFSILPAYSPTWTEANDLDGNGRLSSEELLRAAYTGYYYLENNESLAEAYQSLADKYQMAMDKNALETDYTQLWQDSEVAFMEVSMSDASALRELASSGFTWGLMPLPVKQNEEDAEDEDVNDFLAPVEYTEGPYNPPVTLAPSLIDPAVQDRPAVNADYCIDYLKYITATENLNRIVEYLGGTALGAVSTCAVPQALATWYVEEFPVYPANLSRPARPTLMPEDAASYQELVNQFTSSELTAEEFASAHDLLMYNDLSAYLDANPTDTADWGERYVPQAYLDAQAAAEAEKP